MLASIKDGGAVKAETDERHLLLELSLAAGLPLVYSFTLFASFSPRFGLPRLPRVKALC